MNANEIPQATVLYKSPKSVRKGLSLRDMFSTQSSKLQEAFWSASDDVLMLVSARPGRWYRGESFEEREHAFEAIEDYERRGFRVKILDCSAA